MSGYPDLWCLKSGVCVFVEVKMPGQKPTPLQEHRHNELKQQGFTTIVATSVDDIKKITGLYTFL